MKFINTYHRISPHICSTSKIKRFSKLEFIKKNFRLSKMLNIENWLEKLDLDFLFYNENSLDFWSLAYSGHQFGHFNPTLGDGRAILIGELKNDLGLWVDLQLKGAGPTFFSRGGDGLCAIGPALREYLISEAVFKLNIPTTRTLALIKTGDKILRETALDGAMIIRVANSHLRVGSFQFFYHRHDHVGLRNLLHYSIERLYPEIININDDEKPFEFLKRVIEKQISLVADWMCVGFIHGVMNTDNTSISGETIDYGPCAFMDQFNFQQVYSYIDRNGRYAYSEQAKIIFWNMARLADCLVPLINVDENVAVEKLNTILQKMPDRFQEVFTFKMCKKLGGEKLKKEDQLELITLYFAYLQKENLDFTLSNRFFIREVFEVEARSEYFVKSSEYFELIKFCKNKIDKNEIDFKELDQLNPIYIPRNHLVEKVISDAYQDNFQSLDEYFEILQDPYTERTEIKFKKYLNPPLNDEKIKNTFCGT